ncbi:MAG TPA: alpha/beta hydrolase [Gemmatimonadales bacterium]|nr:alpha/beta hydrolase [Gemmatimonadales bacterium]
MLKRSSTRPRIRGQESTSGYAPINGLELYYEIHGRGKPLILLHGGVVGITMFGANLAAWARERQVVAVELQGHGHTADTARPLTYEAMADDIAALIGHLKIEGADLLGYSLGAGVALQTAIRHPGAIGKLVVVSQACRRDGWYPEVLAGFDQMGPAVGAIMKNSPLAKRYPSVDWGVLFGKLGLLLRRSYDWSTEVAALEAPTMLVFADADAVRLAHIVEFWGLLGGGREDAGLDGSRRPRGELAVLPGVTHYDIGASPLLPAVVRPFLDGSPA